MKKIHTLILGTLSCALLAPLSVSAESATNTTQTTPSIQISCVQATIEKREQSLIAAHQAFNTGIVQALTTRSENLKSAWTKGDTKERRAAIKLAHSTFKSSQSGAHQAMRAARTSSWNTYESEMRACGVLNTGESPSQVRSASTSL